MFISWLSLEFGCNMSLKSLINKVILFFQMSLSTYLISNFVSVTFNTLTKKLGLIVALSKIIFILFD